MAFEFFLETFLAGFSSEADEDDELDSFLAAFLAGAFLAGFSDSLSDELELDSFFDFLAAGFALATTLTDSELDSESELSSTCFFFYGTFWFSATFFALFFCELALLSALALLATGLASDSLSLSEEDDDDTSFFDFFFDCSF